MTQPEFTGETESRGANVLRLVGRDDAIGKRVQLSNGGTIAAEDFLAHCPPVANQQVTYLESLSPGSPEFEQARDDLRVVVEYYVGQPPTD